MRLKYQLWFSKSYLLCSAEVRTTSDWHSIFPDAVFVNEPLGTHTHTHDTDQQQPQFGGAMKKPHFCHHHNNSDSKLSSYFFLFLIPIFLSGICLPSSLLDSAIQHSFIFHLHPTHAKTHLPWGTLGYLNLRFDLMYFYLSPAVPPLHLSRGNLVLKANCHVWSKASFFTFTLFFHSEQLTVTDQNEDVWSSQGSKLTLQLNFFFISGHKWGCCCWGGSREIVAAQFDCLKYPMEIKKKKIQKFYR